MDYKNHKLQKKFYNIGPRIKLPCANVLKDILICKIKTVHKCAKWHLSYLVHKMRNVSRVTCLR